MLESPMPILSNNGSTADSLLYEPSWPSDSLSTTSSASTPISIPMGKNANFGTLDWPSSNPPRSPLSLNAAVDSTTRRLCHSLNDLTIQQSNPSQSHVPPSSNRKLIDSLDGHSNSDSELCHPHTQIATRNEQKKQNNKNANKEAQPISSKRDSSRRSSKTHGPGCLGKSCLKKSIPTESDADGENRENKAKKIVSFADNAGKELFTVKVVQESTYEPPSNIRKFMKRATRHINAPPTSELSSSFNGNNNHSNNHNNNNNNSPMEPPVPVVTVWKCCFQQPASQYISFREKLERDFVSLENLALNMGQYLANGTVKVRNLSFWKEVVVRVTLNRWNTFEDTPTVHQPCSDQHPRFDTFAFSFRLPGAPSVSSSDGDSDPVDVVRSLATRLEFAVCFRCETGEFWDNNAGQNYVLERRRPSLTTPPDMLLVIPNLVELNNTNSPTAPPTTTTVTTATNASNESSSTVSNPPNPAVSLPNLLPYTVDMRPNFEDFDSLTNYRSWQHYNGEGSYY